MRVPIAEGILMILRAIITFLKVLLLAIVGLMAWIQVPELVYDLGASTPVEVKGPEDLDVRSLGNTAFAVIRGTPDFRNAFVYKRYGLDHHYFTVKPYGMRLVVRTYDEITDEWQQLNSFVGRLRPFNRQPFSRYIAAIYLERFGITVPDDAWFLALDDVPKPSGWQAGGLVLAVVIWIALFWLFFLRGRNLRMRRSSPR